MKSILILTTAVIIAITASAMVNAQESPQTGMAASLYGDVKAKKVGDVVSVIIQESNSATKNTQTNAKKSDKASLNGTATTGALSGIFPGMSGTADYSNQYSGQGATTRSGSLNSRMTVKVIDVLPNNNLLVEGSKTMEINEDVEVVTISGIIQPEYISSSNTVLSSQIANAKITYKGKGSISQAQRMGFFARLLNFVF